MLLWQRKNMPKLAFGAQLGFVIVLMHAVAMLLLCIHSVAVHDELFVDASHSYLIGADIFVVPFQKVVKEVLHAVPQSVAPEAQRDTTVIKDIKPAQKKVVPLPDKSVPEKVEPVKPVVKEVVKPEQKLEPEKPAQPEPSSKERVVAEPKALEKIAAPIVPATSTAKPVKSDPSVAERVAQTQPTPQYIGTRQLQTMQIQRAIVEQVQMHWHPPEGLNSDLEVVLAIHIGNNGDVTDVDTQQSSGVFAYDVHARSAVYEMQFPKPCWGKTITIAFK